MSFSLHNAKKVSELPQIMGYSTGQNKTKQILEQYVAVREIGHRNPLARLVG